MDSTIVRAQVIETELRPDEYPTVAMDTLLPSRAAAVVASSTIINRSLPRILRLAQGARIALAEAIRASAMPREFTRFGRYMHIHHDRGTAPKRKFRAGWHVAMRQQSPHINKKIAARATSF